MGEGGGREGVGFRSHIVYRITAPKFDRNDEIAIPRAGPWSSMY